MSTTSRWIVPSFFFENNRTTDPIEFDLLNYLKTFLTNKVWERNFDYGYAGNLKQVNPENIVSASVTIFPRFFHGYVNSKRIPELIEKRCGKFPKYLDIESYKKWSYTNGFAIIEVKYLTLLDSIPNKNDLTGYVPDYQEDFLDYYHQLNAVLQELTSFFLAGIHLSFPTRGHMWSEKETVYDGIFQIKSNRKIYANAKPTNEFMHEVLIEKDKLENVYINLSGLASVWHYNLWPLQRFLKAVDSDKTSMDNLLDLIYALEGLFEKNASSDFVKTMCLIQLCKSKKQASLMREILDHSFRIRNQIAHGERSYTGFENIKIQGKDKLSEDIYWEMKWIVASMILKGISKLIKNPAMRNLRFNNDDLINSIFD